MTSDPYDDEYGRQEPEQVRVWRRHVDEDGEIITISRRADTVKPEERYL